MSKSTDGIPSPSSDLDALERFTEMVADGHIESAREELGRTSAIAQARFLDSRFLEGLALQLYSGDTALHVAGAAHRADIAEALLTMGADVHARNRRGSQPLHYVCVGTPGGTTWNPGAR